MLTKHDYLPIEEAARILRVSLPRISNLCRRGFLVGIKIGRQIFPTRQSVMSYQDNPARKKFLPKALKRRQTRKNPQK